MTQISQSVAQSSVSRKPWWVVGSGYAACIWALLFAGANVYLQLGLPDPLQHGMIHHFTGLIMVLNLSVIPIKLLAALVALGLVQPWGERLESVMRFLLLLAAWGGCAILLGYPMLGVLLQLHIVPMPPLSKAAPGFPLGAVLYGAFFFVAGLWFAIAAWHYQRRLKKGNIQGVLRYTAKQR